MSKLKEKPALAALKAAMVLAFPATAVEDRVVTWWKGIVKDMEGNNVVVMQVANNGPDALPQVKMVLSAYGVTVSEIVEGSSSNLMAIPTDNLVPVIPKRVTHEVDRGGRHYEWKREVVDKLDELGIDHLVMRYSGSGDSSNPDEWECFRHGDGDRWSPKSWDDSRGKHWRDQDSITLPDDLCELISEYVWNTLCQYDCSNNDGGGGHLEIKLEGTEPEFLFTCYTNEMVSTTHQDDEEV